MPIDNQKLPGEYKEGAPDISITPETAKARLRPRPVAAGTEKQFIYNYLEQTILRLDNRDTMREPDFWVEVRKNTIARFGLRNPCSDFDIAAAVEHVHAEYRKREGIIVRQYR